MYWPAVTNAWRAVTPLTARRKEPPQPMHGHAAATVGTQMWIAGGRYGRKPLRSFFCFDTGTFAATCTNPVEYQMDQQTGSCARS